jgi:AmiR/NasT family two-component response regulator
MVDDQPVSSARLACPTAGTAEGPLVDGRLDTFAASTVAEHLAEPGDIEVARLRILIANERTDRLESLVAVVTGLGHDVVAREVDVGSIGVVTARENPDVALVRLGGSSDDALGLIEQIVREASCPVIALLGTNDRSYVYEAAKRGVFAYIVDTTPEELQNAIDVTLQRFAEYHNLQGAFGRRAVIEQAKGILMGRHAIDAETAFGMLRDHSQRSGQKLVDVATGLVRSHALLVPPAAKPGVTDPGK